MNATNSTIMLYINSKRHEVQIGSFDPTTTLLTYLRKIGLTGTKLGCGEGGCGACTVMISEFDSQSQKILHRSANACLFPLYSLDGLAATTIEGIGGMKEGLHPVQKRIASLHGSQCGFCTPGIVMAIYSQLRMKPDSTPEEIEESLDGNLCRCTGYRPILDGAKSLSNNKGGSGCCGGKGGSGCCRDQNVESKETGGTSHHSCTEGVVSSRRSVNEEKKSLNYTEPIFPPALMRHERKSLGFSSEAFSWFQPATLSEFLELKSRYPDAKLVCGNTEIGIETKFKGMDYRYFINPSHIPELNVIHEAMEDGKKGLVVGGGVLLNVLKDHVLKLSVELKGADGRVRLSGYQAIGKMLKWFASNHIRNVATIAGNIITASPISDLNPLLLSCKAVLKLVSVDGVRYVPVSEFFLAYRSINMKSNEILESVFIPACGDLDFTIPFKQARRREDDISIVTSGMRFSLSKNEESSGWHIKEAILAFGGMAPKSIIAVKTSGFLTEKSWNVDTFREAYVLLKEELKLPENVPGGQAEYRTTLTVSFLFKAFLTISNELGYEVGDDSYKSGLRNFVLEDKHQSRGEQIYYNYENSLPNNHEALNNSTRNVVGKPIAHRSSDTHATGEARYTGDIPFSANTAHAVLVLSTRAHARILNVDTSEAEKSDGFIRYFGYKDIPGSNVIGAIEKDEELFAENEVRFFGATIGVVIAETHDLALQAARKVKIEYEDLPAIVTIDEAVAKQSFFSTVHEIKDGNIQAEKEKSDIRIQGSVYTGGQEHFYMEPQCCLAVPVDNNSLEIYSATQNTSEGQSYVAGVLGIPASRIFVRSKRLGGGFGGKETKPAIFSSIVALAALKLGRSIALTLERDIDMSITGQRHAFRFDYDAGCNKDGHFTYLDVKLYSNGGYSLDLSQAVMDRALFHVDNCYKWKAVHAIGKVCKTNQASHTAFRGFGAPQSMLNCETILCRFAEILKVSPESLRIKNLYADGNITYYGQRMEGFHIASLWEKLLINANINERFKAVEEFNRQNRWTKRGICLLPAKYGVNFTLTTLNQGGALVHVYLDGSVLVAHGGTEMGQGLYTKITQIAAECFGIPYEMVIVNESSTATVPNASATAASVSIDLYGMAVMNACQQILDRLKPIRQKFPNADWKTLVNAAYDDRVDLSAHGFYVTPGDRCGYDWTKECENNAERGTPFNYYTQGVGCTEVEVDCLTGDHKVIRVDLFQDIGKSINPAIDIGQIEGAFVQGMGWLTTEELVWGSKAQPWLKEGQLFTRGPGNYKIPAFNDVPIDFRVHICDTNNRYAIHSSKAIGEPPIGLSLTVFFAIKSAIDAARKANGLDSHYVLNAPATSERIRMACGDEFMRMCVPEAKDANHFSPNSVW